MSTPRGRSEPFTASEVPAEAPRGPSAVVHPCSRCSCPAQEYLSCVFNDPQGRYGGYDPDDTGRASKPEGTTGAGVLIPPSHQTYFDTWYGRWVLVTREDGKIWRYLNKRAEGL